MLAWGFWNGQFTPRTFAEAAAAKGYEWAALEIDDEDTGDHNLLLWPQFEFECVQHGLLAGTWTTEGGNIDMTPVDASFAIAELEGPGDYDGIMFAIENQRLPSCSLAVITNFNIPLTDTSGVPRPEKAKPLIDAGFSCLTECYLGDNPNATPDEMDFKARQCGWPTSQPVFGVYNKPPAAYAEWADWPGVDYLGENVL
jgi:hypothetical protein